MPGKLQSDSVPRMCRTWSYSVFKLLVTIHIRPSLGKLDNLPADLIPFPNCTNNTRWLLKCSLPILQAGCPRFGTSSAFKRHCMGLRSHSGELGTAPRMEILSWLICVGWNVQPFLNIDISYSLILLLRNLRPGKKIATAFWVPGEIRSLYWFMHWPSTWLLCHPELT